MNDKLDFLCELKLKRLNPKLDLLYRNSVFACQNMLDKYKAIFPTYTDHTILHSKQIIDFYNRVIGMENIDKLNADEIYILLMAALLHDSGMGPNDKDLEEFSKKLGIEYKKDLSNPELQELVRKNHHEFSGCFIEKYADIFEVPSPEYVYCIKQVSRGHRKTDLFDEKEYNPNYILPNGNKVCLPYLAVLIRLADELDVASDRNILMEADFDYFREIGMGLSVYAFKAHEYIKSMDVIDDKFVFTIRIEDEKYREFTLEILEKLRDVLNYCIKVVKEKTPFIISQSDIEINEIK